MYIVQEIQTNGGVSVALPTITKESKAEAESAFFSICASASVSSVEVHTAIIYDERGNVIENRYFEHPLLSEE